MRARRECLGFLTATRTPSLSPPTARANRRNKGFAEASPPLPMQAQDRGRLRCSKRLANARLAAVIGRKAGSSVFQHRGGTPPMSCRKISSYLADLPLWWGPDRRRLDPALQANSADKLKA